MMSQNFRTLMVSHPFCPRKKSWAKSVKYPRMTDTYCFWSVETLDSCQENDKEGLWSIRSNQMIELVNLVLILMIMLTHGCQRFLEYCYYIKKYTGLVSSRYSEFTLLSVLLRLFWVGSSAIIRVGLPGPHRGPTSASSSSPSLKSSSSPPPTNTNMIIIINNTIANHYDGPSTS